MTLEACDQPSLSIVADRSALACARDLGSIPKDVGTQRTLSQQLEFDQRWSE